ncbi:MAG: hypothetical protein IKR81_00825 [Victivallales bacterium]|nr:hypothetical protein [Victivallales bacterium]
MLGLFLLLPLAAQERTRSQNLQQQLKGGWEEEGRLEISLAAARVRMKTRFERHQFQLKHEIEMGTHNERCLMLWEKEGRQFILMLWRMDVNLTGYSIGEIKDDRN